MSPRSEGSGGFFTVKGDEVRLRVKVRPGSGVDSVVGVRAGELIVKVRARAEKGRANKELVSYLAKWAKIPRREVVIVSGEHSRSKTLSLPLAVAGFLRDLSSAG